MRTYSSHRLPPAGQHDEGSVGNRAQGAQRDRLVEDGRAAELHDVRRFAGRRLQRRAQRLEFQLGAGGVGVDLERDLLPCGRYHHAHSIALANAGPRGQATSTGDASGSVEKTRSSAWSKNSVKARARVVRSMTSTAPGSIPTLSCEMNAQRPSGEYATPCGSGFVVGILATSVRVWASTSDTLCAFLFVTMIHRPSADGSTL